MTYIPEFQNSLVALPSVIALNALLPGGIETLPSEVYDELRADDVGAALEAAEAWYQEAGEGSLEASVAVVLLLEGCDLLDEAAEFVEQARETFGDSPEMALAEAEIRLERLEDDRALAILEGFSRNWEESDEVDPSVWGFAGDLLLDLGEESEAIDCYERALRYGTEDFETAIRLAQMRQEREEWAEAGEAFEYAAELRGDAVGPWAQAAEAWRRAGRIEPSLEARQHVLERRGGEAEIWARQGLGYRQVGEFDKAIEALQKATRLEGSRPEYWIELAHLLRKTGRSEPAIEGYKKVLEVENTFLEALQGLVAAALDQGDVALAEQTARDALQANPENAETWFLLGRTLRRRRQFDEAEDALRRAIEYDAEVADFHRELGELLLSQGEADEAFAELSEAVELSAEDGSVVIPYAEALLRAEQYGRLTELLEARERWSGSAQWQLVRPVLSLIVQGIERSSDDPMPAVERFEKMVDEHAEALPVDYEFDEITRYALVLDEHRQWIVETMVDILEGRRSVEELRPRRK